MKSQRSPESVAATLISTLDRLDAAWARKAGSLGFARLQQRAAGMAEQFGNLAAPPEPPLQQRINAFAKLRQHPEQMVSRDWRLIAWGLADECGRLGRAIDDVALFSRILAEFSRRLDEQSLSRKMWFGLVSSYFSCNPEQGASLQHWLQLRALIIRSFDDLSRRQRSERKWVSVIEANRDVFSDTPGHSLGLALANNQTEALDEFRTYLHVPGESWFWKFVVEQQLKIISQLGDAEFLTRIIPMLSFARTFPFAADTVLSGLLTRYQASSLHDQPHQTLKELALERWGSPQIGSSRNRWSVSVGEDVCKMVMRWFAKEDLETFFKLLQGESGVDQDRLDYWLRFVGQIGFTRIVLGSQAEYDRSSDFVDFRKKNTERISALVRGGAPDDNAFLMQIGSYLITEFSKKGNACYIRPASAVPFKLDKRQFDLNFDLKSRRSEHYRLPHTKGRWQSDYDQWLARVGIFPDSGGGVGSSAQQSSVGVKAPLTVARPVREEAPPVMPSESRAVEAAIRDVLRYAEANFIPYRTQDFRHKGGAFWLELEAENAPMERKLFALGFKYVLGRGYWIK